MIYQSEGKYVIVKAANPKLSVGTKMQRWDVWFSVNLISKQCSCSVLITLITLTFITYLETKKNCSSPVGLSPFSFGGFHGSKMNK